MLAFFLVLFTIIYRHRRNMHIMDRVKMQNEFRQIMLQTQLEIQEQTLRNISQEVHDNIGQVLSLAKLNLNLVDVAEETDAREKVAATKALVSKAIGDLRDLSRSFNTDSISSIGLVNAIRYELETIRKIGVHKTNFIPHGKEQKLDPQNELIVFRITQEALNNIIKHSKAKTIDINVDFTDAFLTLRIADDGKGFNPAELLKKDSSSGMGLQNMSNRARLIGGDIKFNSRPGKGTIITLLIPLITNGK